MESIIWSNYRESVNPDMVEITFNELTEFSGRTIQIHKGRTPKFYQIILQLLDNSDPRLNATLIHMAHNL